MRKDSKKTGTVIITVLIVFFTLLLVFCVWKLLEINRSYATNRREYEELQQLITIDEGQMKDWLPDEEGRGHTKETEDA